jgi:hypothetical protein
MQYVLGNMLNGGGINPDGLSLDLQFAADKTLTARRGPTPTFTRGSTGTFVGSNGLIQTAAINTPRFDHDPVTLVCRGLLIEEGRTNLSLQSGVIVSNSGWATLDVIAAVSGTGLDDNNAYKISEAASTNIHALVNLGGTGAAAATSVVSGTNYTGSVFVKKVTGSVDWVQLTFGSVGFGVSQFANFNISNGTIGNSAGLTAGTVPRIEEFSNGWYRISMTAPATATTSSTGNVILAFTNNTDTITRAPSYLGSTSNEVLTSLFQFEAGSFPTSYIPTTTGSVVRSADVCSITTAGWSNAGNDTMVAEYFIRNLSNFLSGSVVLEGGPAISWMSVSFTGVNQQRNLYRHGGTINRVDAVSGTDSVSLTSINKTALTSGEQIALNGSLSQTLLGDPTQSDISTILNIGRRSAFGGANYLNGHIAAIRYYKKRLPNAKLAQLTV